MTPATLHAVLLRLGPAALPLPTAPSPHPTDTYNNSVVVHTDRKTEGKYIEQTEVEIPAQLIRHQSAAASTLVWAAVLAAEHAKKPQPKDKAVLSFLDSYSCAPAP